MEKLRAESLLFKSLLFYGLHVRHPAQWRVHARLRRLLNADVDRDFEVTRQGLRWVLNPSDYVQNDLFWLDDDDHWDTYHVCRGLSPGAVIFDVGANFGYYSLVLAHVLRRQCSVYSFEPFPVNFARLRKHIGLNGLSEVVIPTMVALSDGSGAARMSAPPENSGRAAVRAGAGGVDVATTTLDGFCREKRIERIDFLKIDVEGYEERVIKGGSRMISSLRPLMMVELSPANLREAGSSPERVVALLQELGYELFVPERRKLGKLERLPSMGELINVIAVGRQGHP